MLVKHSPNCAETIGFAARLPSRSPTKAPLRFRCRVAAQPRYRSRAYVTTCFSCRRRRVWRCRFQQAHNKVRVLSDLLIIKPDAGDMVPASEAYSQKASFYEKMADEEGTSPEEKRLFARKANAMRVLARLEDKRAEALLGAVEQNSVPESMRPPQRKSLWSRITGSQAVSHVFGKDAKACPDGVRRLGRAPA